MWLSSLWKEALTNSAAAVATLRLFVPTNVALSAILRANLAANAANIKIQKIGCGTLLIDRQVPGDLDIAECGYLLAIDNPTPHGTFTVEEGATMIFDVNSAVGYYHDAKLQELLPAGWSF